MKASLFAAAAAALLAAAPIVEPHPGGIGPLAGDPAPAVVQQVSPEAAEAPLPTEGQIGSILAGPLAEHPGTAHVSVRDAVTGEELYGQGQDEAVAPASAMKLLTSATALRTLGAERRFRTRTVLIDPARSAVQTQPRPASTWQPQATAQPGGESAGAPQPEISARHRTHAKNFFFIRFTARRFPTVPRPTGRRSGWPGTPAQQTAQQAGRFTMQPGLERHRVNHRKLYAFTDTRLE